MTNRSKLWPTTDLDAKLTRARRRRLTSAAEAAPHPEPEPAGVLVLEVAEPLGRDEGDDADDGVADGEDAPEDADGLGVPYVVGRVHVRRLDVLHFRAHGSAAAAFFSSSRCARESRRASSSPFVYGHACSADHNRV